ncbi:acyltransferase family protein [Paenibacillus sp. M-152]|uniref:acyltransferase family protein n=1 Tax=Paenibacillus sp. M-152 TaxID=2487928 RepID=UPI000F6B5EDA|nr:acyltransferase family protein [Paenibacillus sp. M-152]AZH31399.1 hypothetical protein EGM68_22990 [Paenibacillus sp. M-152]
MRQKWIDIVRSILIILVVFGHSAFIQYYSNWHAVIYWFHMPAFFFLSGYVFKPKESYTRQAKLITKRLLIPYVIIVVVITFYRYMLTPMSPDIWDELWNIVLGGRFIDGFYAPVWFITCLWATQLIYTAVLKLPKGYMWLLILVMFTTAHFQPSSWKLPGSIDLSLYAILFYALGHQIKWIVNWYCCTLGALSFLFFYYLARQQSISFALDMKQHVLNGKFDLLIPLSGILMIIGIGKVLERITFGDIFVPIGKESLIIMYLHLITALELYRLGAYTNIFLFVFLGIGLPMIINSIMQFTIRAIMIIKKTALANF